MYPYAPPSYLTAPRTGAGGDVPAVTPVSPASAATPMGPALADADAIQIVNVWKAAFPDATALPRIGLPSQNPGRVLTLTHTMGQAVPPMTIDGLPSNSPLANNALYSAEVSNGRFLNLYEIMLPDVPGQNGAPSSAQRYVNTASRAGLSVAGYHFHWSGALMMGRPALAIHTQAANVDPREFARVTIEAIRAAMMG